MTKKVVGIESGARNKVRGRPFAPGNTLGRGRPRGSRNKAKPGQTLLDEYAPPTWYANASRRLCREIEARCGFAWSGSARRVEVLLSR